MVETLEGDWKSISISALKTELDSARAEGKYLIIWDVKGTCLTYLKYMERLYDVGMAKNMVWLNKREKGDVLNELRKTVIGAMRSG